MEYLKTMLISLLSVRRIHYSDDGCQLAWSKKHDGVVYGSWEGFIRIFPKNKEGKFIWHDQIHQKEPVRGLIVTVREDIATCNDFQLTILDGNLEKTIATFPAREHNTCTSYSHIRFPMEQSKTTQNESELDAVLVGFSTRIDSHQDFRRQICDGRTNHFELIKLP